MCDAPSGWLDGRECRPLYGYGRGQTDPCRAIDDHTASAPVAYEDSLTRIRACAIPADPLTASGTAGPPAATGVRPCPTLEQGYE
jgi:hypothetical protein